MIVAYGYGLSASGGAGDIFIYGELGVELVSQQYDIELAGDLEVALDDELTVELDDETI